MLNFSDTTLQKKEDHIRDRYTPIKFSDDVEIKTLDELFQQLFAKRVATYYLNGMLQCRTWRNRSYYDAYMLCRYYFPEMSFKEMYTKLRKHFLTCQCELKRFEFFTCPDVGRAVYDGLGYSFV